MTLMDGLIKNLLDLFYLFFSRLGAPQIASVVMVVLFRSVFVFEHVVSRFLINIKGNVFVDVGAWFGRYVFLLGNKFDKIIIVEPHPYNIEIIKMNLRYSNLRDVILINCAIYNTNGYSYLYLGKCDNHTLIPSFNEKIRVKTLTLDTVLKNQLVDLVKVDVEGVEVEVLKGAESITNNVKRWIVEVHEDRSNNRSKRFFEEWFFSHSYKTKWLDKTHIYAWKE